jgi:hypothetical protein
MRVCISRDEFLRDRQGRTFTDVVQDAEQPFELVLDLFSNEEWQRRMEDAELHHDRPPLAGVVRELEAEPTIDRFLNSTDLPRTKRFRQAVGVLVRMTMERRGWRRTGRKGSMGVRASSKRSASSLQARHNTGGLAFWFLRAERYEREQGMPFLTVRERRKLLENGPEACAKLTAPSTAATPAPAQAAH